MPVLRSCMKLSEKFEEALIYATRAHANQTRKKTGIPFVAHILGVTAIALEYGANETEAIGGRLLDPGESLRRVSTDRLWMHRHLRDAKAAVVGTKTRLHRPSQDLGWFDTARIS